VRSSMCGHFDFGTTGLPCHWRFETLWICFHGRRSRVSRWHVRRFGDRRWRGPVMGPRGAQAWAHHGPMGGPCLGPSWARGGPKLGPVMGPMGGPSLGPSWTHGGPKLGLVMGPWEAVYSCLFVVDCFCFFFFLFLYSLILLIGDGQKFNIYIYIYTYIYIWKIQYYVRSY
jgi:hypothetical protein